MRKFFAFAVLLVFALTLSPLSAGASESPPPQKGQMAPDFTLKSWAGKQVTLSQLRGKIVIVNLWASWCPPCQEEWPTLERLNEVFGGKNFVILAVNEDDDPGALKAFLGKHLHTFTIMHDSHKVQHLYGVAKFPESYIIGRDGKIVEHVIGAIDWSSVGVLRYFKHLIDE
ncbi:MAG TPA: TlpA disulfide reductase family protein [Desulfuromonadales bacterium]|nr:TlpA disulfide reductase family protein [Desulfuromonadales bacterium]